MASEPRRPPSSLRCNPESVSPYRLLLQAILALGGRSTPVVYHHRWSSIAAIMIEITGWNRLPFHHALLLEYCLSYWYISMSCSLREHGLLVGQSSWIESTRRYLSSFHTTSVATEMAQLITCSSDHQYLATRCSARDADHLNSFRSVTKGMCSLRHNLCILI